MFLNHIKNEIGSDKAGSSCHDYIQCLVLLLAFILNLYIIAEFSVVANILHLPILYISAGIEKVSGASVPETFKIISIILSSRVVNNCSGSCRDIIPYPLSVGQCQSDAAVRPVGSQIAVYRAQIVRIAP